MDPSSSIITIHHHLHHHPSSLSTIHPPHLTLLLLPYPTTFTPLGFSTGTLQCLKNNGFVAAIPRGYMSVGRVDPNMVSNVANARAAGFQYVDVYMFPCPTCSSSAEQQFSQLWNAFSASHVNVGMVWLDIEGRQYWSSSTANNQSFYKQLVAATQRVGAKVGIYSSKVQWQEIFGSASFDGGFRGPLWYAHYDNNARCSDFSAFGGWGSPTLKQYVGDTVQCSAGIDISSYC
jgi:hypothetical protein